MKTMKAGSLMMGKLAITMILAGAVTEAAHAACTERTDANGNLVRECIEVSNGGNTVRQIQTVTSPGVDPNKLPSFDFGKIDPLLTQPRLPSRPTTAPRQPLRLLNIDFSSLFSWASK